MYSDSHIKYGGMRFTNNVPEEEINEFVRALPSSHKDSLFEVVKALSSAGLITVEGEYASVDDDPSGC